MRPLTLKTKDFGPLKGEIFLDLSQVSAATISGPNEAGKSTLMTAIPIALFGKVNGRDLEKLIYDLSEEMEVDLTFSHEGEVYRVVRGVKRGKGQTLKLWAGDKEVSERLLTNTQRKLENILKFSPSFLLSTSIAQQDEINRLSTMTPAEREKVLSEMLSLEVWDSKKKKANEILLSNKNVTTEIQDLETNIIIQKGFIEEIQEKIEKFQDDLVPSSITKGLLNKQMEEAETSLRAFEAFTTWNGKRDNLEQRKKDLTNQINSFSIDDGVTEKLVKMGLERKEASETLEEITQAIQLIKDEVNQLRKPLEEVNKFLTLEDQTQILDSVPCKGLEIHSHCQLLASALSTKEKIIVKYGTKPLNVVKAELETPIEKLLADLDFLQENQTKTVKEITDLEKKIASLEGKLEQEKQLETLKDKLKQTLIEIEVHDKEKPLFVKFDQQEYQHLKNRIAEEDRQINDLNLKLAVLDSEQKSTTKLIEQAEKKLEQLKEVDGKLAGYRTLHMAYNEIPTLLFEQAIPTIEEYTNEILEKVSPGKYIQLRSFKETKSNTQQKALDVVSNMSTGSRDFDDLSGSAKFRQSLALRIALSRYNRELNNVDIDFFMVDEGFGSLDEDNTNIMKLMLREISQHFDLFLMVSHVPELRDVFDTQIIVNNTGKGEKVLCLPSNGM